MKRITLLIAALLLMVACDETQGSIMQKIQKGDDLITAIETFKRDTGTYPEEIEALVPKYIDSGKFDADYAENLYYAKFKKGKDYPYVYRLRYYLKPNGFFALGAQEVTILTYDPKNTYINGLKRKIIKRIGKWVIHEDRR